MRNSKAQELVQTVSKQTGVSVTDVQKVLDHLGLGDAIELVAKSMGDDTVAKLESKQVIVGVRFANAMVCR